MQENSHTRNVKVGSILFLFSAIVAVFVDEVIKKFALENFINQNEVESPSFLTFEIHKNFGIAFNIPFKPQVVVFLTIILFTVLCIMAIRSWRNNKDISIACFIILIGALGNLYDRVFYGFTVDYLIFFGRSAINLSDIVILIGILLFLTTNRKRKSLK